MGAFCVKTIPPPVSSFLVILMLFLCSAPAFGQDAPSPGTAEGSEIFILNSAHPGHPWSDKEQATIVDQLRKKKLSSQPVIEYMGFKRDPQGRHLPELTAKLRRQYLGDHFSLVFALDEPALTFALAHHGDIFGGAPIVFMGVCSFTPELLKGDSRVTGVVDFADPSANIELMLRLHPKTRQIFILHDYTPSGIAIRRNYEAILPGYTDRVSFRFSDNVPVEEIFRDLERMPPDSLVFQLTYTTDGRGTTFAQEDLTEQFSAHSTVPIYDRSATRLGYGIVGGKLIDPQVVATEAVILAERILRGEDVRTIPPVYKNSSHYMFDYRQLERFNIPMSLLPLDSTVINRPVSFFVAYKNIVFAAAGAMLILLVAVLFLVAYGIQRRRMVNVLRSSEARYHDLYDNAPDMYWSVDAGSGSVMQCNETVLRATGYTREEIIGRPAFQFYHPDSAEDAKRAFGQFVSTGEVRNVELKARRKDGTAFEISLSASAVRDKNGNVVGSRSTWRDITDRKQAEKALQESEDLFRLLVDEMTDGLVILDWNGDILFSNAAGLRLVELDPGEESIGTSVGEFVHPDDLRGMRESLHLVKAGGKGVTFVCRIITSKGNEKWIEAVGTTVHFRGSDVDMTNIRDITGQKQAEEERIRVESQLQQAQKMEAIGTLAGGIAHDFNNLLTGILGHSNLLRLNHPPDSQVYEAARTIERAAERASELTQQLLGFARRGKHQIQPVNIHELILEATRLLGRTIDKRILIAQRFVTGTPLVKGDPGQLQQVVMNLAINARDAMENGGELSFDTGLVDVDEAYCQAHVEARVGRYLLIAVTDTGHGIPADLLGRIFEPFYTTKEPGKGSGMGLAMVYGIVKNHEGFVNVYSEVGHGTTFNVYLPLEQEASSPEQKQDGEGLATGAGRILLIDDEEMVRGLAAKMLTVLGYEVETAGDGEEGVRLYREAVRTFDLVIIDMIMPKLGGRDCFRELKKINPDIKVILSTGYGINGKAQEILDDGVMGFIQKPYRIDQLGRTVRHVIGGA